MPEFGAPPVVDEWTELIDTPASYVGQALKVPRVKADETGQEFATPSGVGTFLELTDTPDSYSGQAGKAPKVNATEEALEFASFILIPASSVQGDILYHNGSVYARLAKGTQDYYLKQGATIPEWAAVAGGGDLSWLRHRKVGSRFAGIVTLGTGEGAFGVTANYLQAIPIWFPASFSADMIGIYVHTAGAGLARLGLYADDATTYPGALQFDAGTVDVSTTGLKEIAITKTMAAGLYWLVIVPNIDHNIAATLYSPAASIMGADASLNWVNRLRKAFTYAALPATFPAGATEYSDAWGPSIHLRRSA